MQSSWLDPALKRHGSCGYRVLQGSDWAILLHVADNLGRMRQVTIPWLICTVAPGRG